MLDLIASGEAIGASAAALTLTTEKLKFLYENLGDFADRIVLRPQEISNNPGIARLLGVIATNTAIEVDLYGHVNSTHIMGTQLMNGLGGSGDFERNAYLSVFMCPSTAKGGRISTIVPMCSHMDHSEHSVQVVVTEQGLADLRGLSPTARSRRIIENCAHPAYRDALYRYLEGAPMGHIRHDLRRCFAMHLNYLEHGACCQTWTCRSSSRTVRRGRHKGPATGPGIDGMIEKELALTPDFPPVDYDQWRARVEAAGRSGLMTAADGAESVIRAIGLG